MVKLGENSKNDEFKIDSDMINLIGCSKENFFKLLELMEYKSKKNNDNKKEIFVYRPKLIKRKELKSKEKISKNSPFEKLSEIRFR